MNSWKFVIPDEDTHILCCYLANVTGLFCWQLTVAIPPDVFYYVHKLWYIYDLMEDI